jgi:hypothetical protein
VLLSHVECALAEAPLRDNHNSGISERTWLTALAPGHQCTYFSISPVPIAGDADRPRSFREQPFYTRLIPFTDFPLDYADIWAGFDGERWTLYLPSEHLTCCHGTTTRLHAQPFRLPAGKNFGRLHEPLANLPLFLEEAETIGRYWGIITLR